MLDPLNPEAISFLRDVYREMVPAFTSDIFNANCDEAWDLSRAELTGEAASLGVARIYSDHIRRIDTTLLELGKRTLIWGDIIMDYPEILDQLPKYILTGAWNYDARESFADFIDPLKNAGFDFTISPGILNSNRLFPDYQMTFANIRNLVNKDFQKGTKGVFLTSQTTEGLIFSTLTGTGSPTMQNNAGNPTKMRQGHLTKGSARHSTATVKIQSRKRYGS